MTYHYVRHPARRGASRWFWSEGEHWETRTDRDGEERLVRKVKSGDHPEPRRER